jgi:SAM-dependent methyltransferase
VGPAGHVIGVDMNEEMLALARKYQKQISATVGYDNVEFRKGRIQDLQLDRQRLDAWIESHPVLCGHDLVELEHYQQQLRVEQPLIPDESINVVISNCVLNLVDGDQKSQLFREIYRILKRGGRAVISDIVCDEDVPESLRQDPALWSGCISGALREEHLLRAFEEAGFYGIHIAQRSANPWKTIQGIEFRSATVIAFKGKEGECRDHKEAVIYRGPFREVLDDDGHRYRRGDRVAVCRKTFQILQREPYLGHFEAVPPLQSVSPEDAGPFRCSAGTQLRSPKETKGEDYKVTEATATSCCEPGECG